MFGLVELCFSFAWLSLAWMVCRLVGWLEAEISETLKKVSVSTTFTQSRPVSVSTPFEFLGLEESRSRQLSKYPVSKSLGLDIFCFLSLADSLSINYIENQYYHAYI